MLPGVLRYPGCTHIEPLITDCAVVARLQRMAEGDHVAYVLQGVDTADP